MLKDPGNTFKTAQLINVSSFPQVLRNAVSPNDKFDVYRFTLGAKSSFNALLTGLKAKADVSLYNSFGKLIKRSTFSPNGRTLKTALSSGTYYIAVAQISGNTAYRLKLSATQPNPVVPPPPSTVDLLGNGFSPFPTSFSGLSQLSSARSFSVDYSIRNTGNLGVSQFSVGFYLSNNSTISTSDYLLATYDITNMPALGTTPTFRANLNLPGASDPWWRSNLGEGYLIKTYYVGMVIDPQNAIAELNETNNSSTGDRIDYSDITISNPTGEF